MKTLEYPPTAISLFKKEWDRILQPALNATLPKSGLNRNFSRDIVFAPTECQGLGLRHPCHLQCLRQIEMCLRETSRHNLSGQLLHTTVKQFKLELGFNSRQGDWRIKESSACLTDTWFANLLHCVSHHDLALKDDTGDLSLRRFNDRFLMLLFINAEHRGQQLYQLNICRMHMRVITLADICNAAGTATLPAAMKGAYINTV